MYTYHVHAWFLQRLEEKFFYLELKTVVSHHMSSGDQNLALLQKKLVVLTTEPSF